MQRQQQTSADGFTLIEMMMVVVIIGLLVGVVSVKVVKSGETSRISATRASIHALKLAVGLFEMQVGRYPASLQELVIEGDENWPGPFIDAETVPKDAWGGEFKYEIIGKRARITSAGKDGQTGTDDDLWSH